MNKINGLYVNLLLLPVVKIVVEVSGAQISQNKILYEFENF